MNKLKLAVFVLVSVLLFSSVSYASTLNLGRDSFKLRVTNFHPQSGAGNDYVLFNLGYGLDKDRGYGLEVITGKNQGIAHLEYQFTPPVKKEENKNFDYAVKVGGVSGNLWDEEDRGGKVGIILEKKLDEQEIYFDGDIISGRSTVIDVEVGFCGELGPGVLGVLGYKVIASQEEGNIKGAHYGLKINF